MKILITSSVIVAIIALAPACKKKKTTEEKPATTPAPVTYPSYSRLKAGNYWIYGRYQVEQDGTSTYLNQSDSCYVEKDTLIRNHTFYKIHKHDFVFNDNLVFFERDSLHYIVDSDGRILFSSEDFSTVFYTTYVYDSNTSDTLYKVSNKMNDKDLVVQVPAGSFTTSNMQATYTRPASYAIPGINNPRYLNTRYAINTGIISETELFYATTNNITERRLLRYHLN